jgi:hypothetical protein
MQIAAPLLATSVKLDISPDRFTVVPAIKGTPIDWFPAGTYRPPPLRRQRSLQIASRLRSKLEFRRMIVSEESATSRDHALNFCFDAWFLPEESATFPDHA